MNYNAGDDLLSCVNSLLMHVQPPFEILVVDNDSYDGSLELLLKAPEIKMTQNLGFSKACNEGVRHATGEVLHFINPDSEVHSDINDTHNLVGRYEKPALFSTRIVDETGH